MADRLSPDQRHFNMSHVRSSNTKPELALRHALWHMGFRYRVNYRRLPGKPDIVLPKYRTVIFIHGCFWHGHKGCRFYSVPKTNTDFWKAKIARNQERDQEVWRQLEAKGWYVIIVWECQLKNAELNKTIRQVTEEIMSNGREFDNLRNERETARELYRKERMLQRGRESVLMSELKGL